MDRSCCSRHGKEKMIIGLVFARQFCVEDQTLIIQAPTPQNGQAQSNNLSAVTDELFECV